MTTFQDRYRIALALAWLGVVAGVAYMATGAIAQGLAILVLPLLGLVADGYRRYRRSRGQPQGVHMSRRETVGYGVRWILLGLAAAWAGAVMFDQGILGAVVAGCTAVLALICVYGGVRTLVATLRGQRSRGAPPLR